MEGGRALGQEVLLYNKRKWPYIVNYIHKHKCSTGTTADRVRGEVVLYHTQVH